MHAFGCDEADAESPSDRRVDRTQHLTHVRGDPLAGFHFGRCVVEPVLFRHLHRGDSVGRARTPCSPAARRREDALDHLLDVHAIEQLRRRRARFFSTLDLVNQSSGVGEGLWEAKASLRPGSPRPISSSSTNWAV
jgi:hypothetical protein